MGIKREDLEKQALEEICSCRYYDLADNIDSASDEDLWAVINHTDKCDICGD